MSRLSRLFLPVMMLLAWLLPGQPASAASGVESLKHFLSSVKSLEADFVQAQDSDNGHAQGPLEGTMMLLRPDRFRWDYQHPYEQLIIGDGNKVWFWDKDLEQITVKRLDEALGSTPAVLLSGSANVEDRYLITEFERTGPFDWAELTPINTEGNFEKIWIGFSDGVLRVVELRDSFGQTTRIQFSRVRINGRLDPEFFTFLPPAGVDVIGE